MRGIAKFWWEFRAQDKTKNITASPPLPADIGRTPKYRTKGVRAVDPRKTVARNG